MIDFRYHLVSLIAVFLAVALGIVIGTTALNEPILADIKHQVSALEKDKRSLEDRTQTLQAQLNTTDTFARRRRARPGRRHPHRREACCWSSPTRTSPTDTVDERHRADRRGRGGGERHDHACSPHYSDPSTATSRAELRHRAGLPPGVQLPPTDDAGQLVGSLLAQMLMIPPGGSRPRRAADLLGARRPVDARRAEPPRATPCHAAPTTPSSSPPARSPAPTPTDRNTDVAELVTALDTAGSGAVVAGDTASAADTGLVGLIRADPTLSAAVSTVDNVDTAAGHISTVLALGRRGRGHVRQVRHRGGHPAGPAGAGARTP